MNYSEMSGYEINNRVHNIVVCGGKYDLTVEGYRVTWKNRETGEEIVTLRKQYDKQFKDYLGSWADAGPIIEENGIAIMPFKMATPTAFPSREGLVSARLVEHENVLRAAMIVFLMMQEAK